MPIRGLRKLVDIPETSTHVMKVLENFLDQHNIAFAKHSHHRIERYLVSGRDLCCARSVLLALEQIADERVRHSAPPVARAEWLPYKDAEL